MTNGNGTKPLIQRHREFISKEEIRFWVPLITMIVSVTVWGMSLSNKIDLVANDIKEFGERIVKVEDRGDRFAQVLNDWSIRLVTAETKLGIR